MPIGHADWDDRREEIKMVFEHYPSKYFQCKDFTETLGLALDRAYMYLEQLREEGVVDLSWACSTSEQACGDPIHDSYYKHSDESVDNHDEDGWFGLEKPNEAQSVLYRLEVDKAKGTFKFIPEESP